MKRHICSAAFPSSAVCVWGSIVISARSYFTDAFSRASLTASKSSGAVIISKQSPSSFTSSAPASSPISMRVSSSASDLSTVIRPFLSNIHETHPSVPMLPPALLKIQRTSAMVLFLLSVRQSTRTATPPGP